MRRAHPVLNLASSNHRANNARSRSSPVSPAVETGGLPSSIPSSIPTISSLPVTPDTAQYINNNSSTLEYVAFIDPEDGLLTFTNDQLSKSLHNSPINVNEPSSFNGGSNSKPLLDGPTISRTLADRERAFASLDSSV
ncbi:hypothetical protein K435DRAFT_490753 [Dendrothele bispora CBS 962.96]|uniref:Uncharacterized protein n=1 Tax=Dendrothele bispora (strain CBS 962.96) TaxID=1314807 RepID=A0A4S8MC67_DENBC|nr:hypothetical protein K435DRAFT_490753 [Dendrothele bispora CBS 962.96]